MNTAIFLSEEFLNAQPNTRRQITNMVCDPFFYSPCKIMINFVVSTSASEWSRALGVALPQATAATISGYLPTMFLITGMWRLTRRWIFRDSLPLPQDNHVLRMRLSCVANTPDWAEPTSFSATLRVTLNRLTHCRLTAQSTRQTITPVTTWAS